MSIKFSNNKNDDYGGHNKTLHFSHLFIGTPSTINNISTSKTTGSQQLKEWLEKGDVLFPNGSPILPNGYALLAL